MLFHDLTAVSILAIKIMSFIIKDCGILISLLTNSQPWHLCKYNFNSEDMSVTFSDSLTFFDQYDTFFIQIRSVEAELRACEDW